MPAVSDDFQSAAPDAIDKRIADREDPRVEDLIVGLAGKRRMVRAKRENVGDRAGREPARLSLQRLGAAGPDRLEHRPAGRRAWWRADIPRPLAQPLRIFELAQFRGDADQHVGIRADSVASAGADVIGRIEDPVAQIALRDRTKPGDRARARKVQRLAFIHVGRMDEAPFFIDAGMVEQPTHRTRAQGSDAVLHFLDLFGGVNVNGTVAGERHKFGQFARRHGAKAMGRNADRLSLIHLDHLAAILDKTRE